MSVAAPLLIGLLAIGGYFRTPAAAPLIADVLLFTGIALVAFAAALLLLRLPVRDPRDYYGGLVLFGLALFMLWAGSDLPGTRGFAFGPGTGPRIFASVLAGLSLIVMIVGMFAQGPGLERYAWRGPFFLTVGTLVFAVMIRQFGLVIATFASLVTVAAGSSESRVIETLIWSAVLTGFAVLVFPIALSLPLQLWPSPNLSFSTFMNFR
ncbi:tripartite tricarboxylate transporter TctB family protein [Rhodoplanes azumiensis]|uniref:Tripartite tricarboxylate transporter TctB family protein n=1 Tax=Rhodoplanes azumiensis TaxID=1897628 RepID=A0ABW5AJ22_9BRAD